MSVGKSIRYYREQKDVSQQWLANAIGVSKMTVSNFESDKKYPNVEMVKKICEALGITLGKLMSYKEDIEIANCEELFKPRRDDDQWGPDCCNQ